MVFAAILGAHEWQMRREQEGLEARKQLAAELSYGEDTSDSAKMNIWLHRQVMTKLAANGGTVPAELRD